VAPDGGYRFEAVGVDVGAAAPILDDVCLAVPRGGLTCIAGPSGSGKSTLLRLCNRLEVPTWGRLLLDGTDVRDLDVLALRRRAGMVFQRPVTFPGTVRDNLLVADPAADDGRCTSVLDRVGLGAAFLDRRADDLSGGEAQRLCIARALLTGPEILLLDEATASLDVDARLVVEALARDLVADGLTLLWVTHDLDQAERLGDRTVVVVAGRVVAEPLAGACLAARSFALAGPTGERGPEPGRGPAGPAGGSPEP
jgi:putative ABC transport system ATP-binding protein